MAKISLICEQCGGNIILDNSQDVYKRQQERIR